MYVVFCNCCFNV